MGDWQEGVYRKIEIMKEMYIPDLMRCTKKLRQNGVEESASDIAIQSQSQPYAPTLVLATLVHTILLMHFFISLCEFTCFESGFKIFVPSK